MKKSFKIESLEFNNIRVLPNGWTNANYIELLELMDYGDTSSIIPDDLKEMCLLSLTDNEPDEAAEIVLKHTFKDQLNSGQIQNLSQEMLDEKMWEEYADLSFHEAFFNVGQLLYQAYNGKFPLPEAVSFKVSVAADDVQDLTIFDQKPEAHIIKLLAQGMPENSIINRLFKNQLNSDNFTDAKHIIWQLEIKEGRGNSLDFNIISSHYFFQDFKFVESFEAVLKDEQLEVQVKSD